MNEHDGSIQFPTLSFRLNQLTQSKRLLTQCSKILRTELDSFDEAGTVPTDMTASEYSAALRQYSDNLASAYELVAQADESEPANLENALRKMLLDYAVACAALIQSVFTNGSADGKEKLLFDSALLMLNNNTDSEMAYSFLEKNHVVLELISKAAKGGLHQMTAHEIEGITNALSANMIPRLAQYYRQRPHAAASTQAKNGKFSQTNTVCRDSWTARKSDSDSKTGVKESLEMGINDESLQRYFGGLSDEILSLQVRELDLDNRAKNVLIRNGIRSLRQVKDMTMSQLSSLKNMGSWSVKNILTALENLSELSLPEQLQQSKEYPEEPAKQEVNSLFSIFLKCQDEQRDPDRTINVMMKRWGGCGRIYTLQEIGSELGLTRERIRQFEDKYEKKLRRRAGTLIRCKLAALFDERETPLYLENLSEEDDWFAGFQDLKADGIADPFLFLGSMIAGVLGDYFVCEVEGRKILCRINNTELNELKQKIYNELKNRADQQLTLQATVAYINDACRIANVPELCSVVLRSLQEALNFGCVDDEVFLSTVGTSPAQTVMAVLQTAEKPLHYSEIVERCRIQYDKHIDPRTAARILQDMAFLYNRGTYGLKRHFPLSEEQENDIREELENIIEEGAVDRQWHCDELLNLLDQQRSELAKISDIYIINITLQGSNMVRYLKRFVWVHTDSTMYEAADRKLITQCAIDILRKRGTPLGNDDLIDALMEERGVKRRQLIHPNERLIRIDRATWGLTDRDLPLSTPQQFKLLDLIVDRLEVGGKGLVAADVIKDISLASSLTTIMLASLAQTDPRLRVDRNQMIHLTEWGDVKGFSLRELIREQLAHAQHALPLETLWRSVVNASGRDFSKQQVSAALNNINAYFDKARDGWVISS